jgi:hypothetical protein
VEVDYQYLEENKLNNCLYLVVEYLIDMDYYKIMMMMMLEDLLDTVVDLIVHQDKVVDLVAPQDKVVDLVVHQDKVVDSVVHQDKVVDLVVH